MALAMLFGVSSSALAAEVSDYTEEPSNILALADSVNKANDDNILHSFTRFLEADHAMHFSATPPKGTTLKVVCACSSLYPGGVTIEVTKNGGWWPSTKIEVPNDSTTRIYTLIENCNGEEYSIKVYTNFYDDALFVGDFYYI